MMGGFRGWDFIVIVLLFELSRLSYFKISCTLTERFIYLFILFTTLNGPFT